MAGGNSTSQGISSAHQAAYTVVWGIALAVNLTNCIILGRTAYVKRSCPNLLTFLLTVVDVWVLLAGLLPAVVALFEQDLLENYAGLCSYQAVIINSWFIVASSLVVIIAFDRYLAVCHPFDYSRRFAGTSSLYIVSIFVPIVTFFALILACLPLMLGRGFRVVPPGIYCFITWGSRDARDVAVTVINLVYCFIVLLLLTGLTVAVCCGIYKMVRAGRERTGDRSNNRVQQSQNALEILFAKLGIVMAIVFSACTMPASIVMTLQLATQHLDGDIDYIVLSVLLLNVVMNPFLHAIVRKPVRLAYLEMVKWLLYGCCCGWRLLRPKEGFDNVLGVVRDVPVVTTSLRLTQDIRCQSKDNDAAIHNTPMA